MKMGGFLLNRRELLKCLQLVAIVGLSALSGCGRFFVSQNSTTTPPTNTTAGDVLYVAATVGESVSAYSVSTAGALTAVSGSPYSLGTPPLSMAITPSNTFLYVGEAAGIVGYSVGTGGVLTEVSSGAALASDVLGPLSMQVDTTGGFLMAAGINLTAGTPEIGIYQIDASAGTLTALNGSPLTVAAGSGATGATPTQLYIAPNNQDVYLTFGEGGTEILTFDASSGNLSDAATHISLSAKGVSQTGVVANAASSLLFVSETTSAGGVVRVLTIGSNGSLTEITGSPFAVGNGPGGIVLNSAGTDLYVANKGIRTR